METRVNVFIKEQSDVMDTIRFYELKRIKEKENKKIREEKLESKFLDKIKNIKFQLEIMDKIRKTFLNAQLEIRDIVQECLIENDESGDERERGTK